MRTCRSRLSGPKGNSGIAIADQAVFKVPGQRANRPDLGLAARITVATTPRQLRAVQPV